MKLGNSRFYQIEYKKQLLQQTWEHWPYMGGVCSIFFFCYFAITRPLNLKLYKELLMSYVYGLGVSSSAVIYYHKQYMKEIDVQYRALKQMFADNPKLELIDDDKSMNKNFGLSQYTEYDTEEEVEMATDYNIFEGAENSRAEAIKKLTG